jgi:hypothetical protein
MAGAVEDRDSLIAALRSMGVDYLTGGADGPAAALSEKALISRLASHPEARLRQALIALFLLHPELSRFVADLSARLPKDAGRELRAHYMAAVYLQQMWSIRLRRYIGDPRELEDYFSQSLNLPKPRDGHGRFGLHALAEWHKAASPVRANHLAEYEGTAKRLMESLSLRRRRNDPAKPG